MAFQTTVGFNIGAGLPGEKFDDGPTRAQPFTFNSATPANNIFGRAFTVSAEGVAQVGSGGARGFGGILVNPKEHASLGNATDGPFGTSYALPNGVVGTLLSEGSVWVTLPAAANIGDVVYFNNTTGVIVTTAPGAAAPATSTLIKGAYVDRFTVTAAGLAVITIPPISRSQTLTQA